MSARNAANIANAQHSTGPRSVEGKQRASQNARRHGLTAKTLVLDTEDRAAFEDLRAALRTDYGPKTELEDALLDALVESHWRLLRLRRTEVAFHNQCIKQLRQEDPGLDADSALGLMLADPKASAQLRLFLRYQSPIERAYREAEKKLMTVIRTRIEIEQTCPHRRPSQAGAALGYQPRRRTRRPRRHAAWLRFAAQLSQRARPRRRAPRDAMTPCQASL